MTGGAGQWLINLSLKLTTLSLYLSLCLKFFCFSFGGSLKGFVEERERERERLFDIFLWWVLIIKTEFFPRDCSRPYLGFCSKFGGREMAQQHPHVPKFGNWESEENVPYTAYFDKARKGRTGTKLINPNDPAENPDILNYGSSAGAPAPTSRARAEEEKPVGYGAVKPAQERRRSKDDDDLRQFINSPAHHDNLGRRAVNDSAHQQHGGRGASSGEAYRRPVKQSAGSEQSIERSPIHRQARVSGRDSPSWEGKNSYDSSHGTPGRSRLRPRGDETPDQGAAVPKFGEWDENNPSSADGFTHIFNKVREERQIGVGNVSGTPERSYPSSQKPDNNASQGCCFPWCRK